MAARRWRKEAEVAITPAIPVAPAARLPSTSASREARIPMHSGLRTQQKEKSDPAKEIRTTTAINHMAKVETTKSMERTTERDMASTGLIEVKGFENCGSMLLQEIRKR